MRDAPTLLTDVDEVRRKLDAQRPYTPDVVKRLDDWLTPRFLYTTTAIGSQDSLSASEVTAFLEREIVSGGHPLDSFLAVNRHHTALDLARQRSREGGEIDVAFLQDLHRTIYGSGPGGDAFRPGLWKDAPSQRSRRRGHAFVHAEPEEVPELVDRLLAGLAERRQEAHPVEAVTWFYFHLYKIQPFTAGNGRVARLVLLSVLLNHGYPPLIVHPDALGDYMDSLVACDQTVTADRRELLGEHYDLSPLLEFVATHLVRAGESMLDVVTGRRITAESLVNTVGEAQDALVTRLLARKNTSWRLRATLEVRALHERVVGILKKFHVRGPIYTIELVRHEVVPRHSCSPVLFKALPGADAGLVGECEVVIRGNATTQGVRFPEPVRLVIGVTGTSIGLQLLLSWDGRTPEVRHGRSRASEWPTVTLSTLLASTIDGRRRGFERAIDQANATASQRIRAMRAEQLRSDAEAEAESREPWRDPVKGGQQRSTKRSSPRTERATQHLDGVTPSEPPLSF